jgi:hypothetical protein
LIAGRSRAPSRLQWSLLVGWRWRLEPSRRRCGHDTRDALWVGGKCRDVGLSQETTGVASVTRPPYPLPSVPLDGFPRRIQFMGLLPGRRGFWRYVGFASRLLSNLGAPGATTPLPLQRFEPRRLTYSASAPNRDNRICGGEVALLCCWSANSRTNSCLNDPLPGHPTAAASAAFHAAGSAWLSQHPVGSTPVLGYSISNRCTSESNVCGASRLPNSSDAHTSRQ